MEYALGDFTIQKMGSRVGSGATMGFMKLGENRWMRPARRRKIFQAKLIGVDGLPKPIQVYGNSQVVLEKWANEVLQKYPQGRIEIWEDVPVLRKTLGARVKEG